MTEAVADATRREWDISFIGAFDIGRDSPALVHSLATGHPDETDMRAAVARGLDIVASPQT